MLEDLKADVCLANLELVRYGLVNLTWGNVSGINEDRDLVVIKPGSVDFQRLDPEQMVVVDLDGNVVEGDLRPSSDVPSHVRLYKHFENIGGITHTHSARATAFAQARTEIPCLGTTHANHFNGPVPVTRPLTEREVAEHYQANTGKAIIERFAELNPEEMPAVLVAGHGPFAWGRDARDSVQNAATAEAVAKIAMFTMAIDSQAPVLESYVLDKHQQRKRGTNA